MSGEPFLYDEWKLENFVFLLCFFSKHLSRLAWAASTQSANQHVVAIATPLCDVILEKKIRQVIILNCIVQLLPATNTIKYVTGNQKEEHQTTR